MGGEEKISAMNFFLVVGYDNMQNRNFSDRIVSLGKNPLPTEFLTTGFGFSLVREKWTILNLDMGLGRSTDFSDDPNVDVAFFFSHLKAGVAYNLFDVQHRFRLEPGIGLVLARGQYQLQSSQQDVSFDQAVGSPLFNEINLRQNNYGLNFNLTFSQNQFFDPKNILSNFFGLEVGANLMFFSNQLAPNFAESPDLNLSAIYFKVKINVISP